MTGRLPVQITITLDTVGWGQCLLRVGDQEILLDGISWGTDALGDLARLALAAAVGERRATCRWDGEPAETRILAESTWTPEMRKTFGVRVLSLGDYWANLGDAAGEEWFNAECDPEDFARAVLSAIRAVGPETYKHWNHPYPHRVLVALEAALRVPKD